MCVRQSVRNSVLVPAQFRLERWGTRLPLGTPYKGDPFHLFVLRDKAGTVEPGVRET